MSFRATNANVQSTWVFVVVLWVFSTLYSCQRPDDPVYQTEEGQTFAAVASGGARSEAKADASTNEVTQASAKSCEGDACKDTNVSLPNNEELGLGGDHLPIVVDSTTP